MREGSIGRRGIIVKGRDGKGRTGKGDVRTRKEREWKGCRKGKEEGTVNVMKVRGMMCSARLS